MPYERLTWPVVPNGVGFQALQEILGHLKDMENVDPKCASDDAMTLAHAIRSKIYPGMPDNPVTIGAGHVGAAVAEALGSDDELANKQLCCDVIEAYDALSDEPTVYASPLITFDWSQLIKILLPIILKLLENWLSPNDPDPMP